MFKGAKAWQAFQHEGGKHCVQRNPRNQRKDRTQTSMIAVAVTPMVAPGDFRLDMRDVEISIQAGDGPGGQARNRTMSCVQLRHRPTNTIVRIDNERSQHQNKAIAIEILTARLAADEDEKIQNEQSAARREQMQGGGRSGKIRTYNFKDKRVVDHRLNKSTTDVDGVMKGRFDRLFR